MKEALHYKKLDNNKVKCLLCPNTCTITENNVGFCGVRKNIKGKLFSLVYEKAVAINIDPIEKKPLYHFYPSSPTFSLGTVGCNLCCKFCQNWEISQVKDNRPITGHELTPKQIVDEAIKNNCKIIAYTYTEPTIFYEYMLETAKLAKKHKLKNIIISNGYINPKPLKELIPYIDGANIDLKAFNEEFYRDLSCASLKPVLETIKTLKKNDVWIEITNLIIENYNTNFKEIEKMCQWVKNIDPNIPLHFSKSSPMYKMMDIKPTTPETLLKAKKIADKYLNYTYIGNIQINNTENTFCPKCKELLIERSGFFVSKIKKKCKCGFTLAGKF